MDRQTNKTRSHQTNEILLTLGHKKKCALTNTLVALLNDFSALETASVPQRGAVVRPYSDLQ